MRHRGMAIGLVSIALVYVIAVVLSWLALQPFEFGDTYRYFGSTLWDIQNPGITPVFVYTHVIDHAAVVAIQVTMYAVAWMLLAFVAWRRLRYSAWSWVLAVLILFASLTAPLWSWNALLGSESLAITSAVLWLASLIWLADHSTRITMPLLLNALAATALIVTRPAMVPIVLAVEITAIVWSWRSSGRPAMPLVAMAITALASVYGVIRLQLLATDSTFRYRYAIDNFVDKTDSFRTYAQSHMGTCEPLTTAVNGPKPWDDVWQVKEQLAAKCPDAYMWLRSSKTALLNWSAQMPGDALVNWFGAMKAVTLEPYAPARALPEWMNSILVPAWNPLVIGFAYLLVGVLIAGAVRVRNSLSWRWWLAFVAIAAAVFITAFSIWGADGIELNRHLMPLSALLPVAALALPATLPSRRQAPTHAETISAA